MGAEALTLTRDDLTGLIGESVTAAIREINKPAEEDRPAAPAAPAVIRHRYSPPRLGKAMTAAYRGGWRSSETFEKDLSQATAEVFGYKGEAPDKEDPLTETIGAGKNYRSIFWPKSRSEMSQVLMEMGEKASGESADMAIRAMTIGSAGSGGELAPPIYMQDLFSYDLISTIAFRQVPGIRWMPVRQASIILPRESARAGASQANEAATLDVQDATTASQTIAVRKQYGFRRYSNELLADADPAWNEFLANTLVRDVALQQDIQYLEGNNSAPQIQGLYDYTGNLDVSSGTNGASPTFDLFYDTQYELRKIGAEPDFVICHPRVLNSLAKIKDADGNYMLSNQSGVNAPQAFGTGLPGAAPKGVILGSVPMWFSSQINIARTVGGSSDCTSVYMGQSNQVIGLERQGIEIAFSEHLYFNTDETAARAIARSAIAVLQPDAVAQINGVRS